MNDHEPLELFQGDFTPLNSKQIEMPGHVVQITMQSRFTQCFTDTSPSQKCLVYTQQTPKHLSRSAKLAASSARQMRPAAISTQGLRPELIAFIGAELGKPLDFHSLHNVLLSPSCLVFWCPRWGAGCCDALLGEGQDLSPFITCYCVPSCIVFCCPRRGAGCCDALAVFAGSSLHYATCNVLLFNLILRFEWVVCLWGLWAGVFGSQVQISEVLPRTCQVNHLTPCESASQDYSSYGKM